MSPGSLLAGDSGINLSRDTVSRTAFGGRQVTPLMDSKFVRLETYCDIYLFIFSVKTNIQACTFIAGVTEKLNNLYGVQILGSCHVRSLFMSSNLLLIFWSNAAAAVYMVNNLPAVARW